MTKSRKNFLVLGTSTEVGKTFFTCQIVEKFLRDGGKINAIKPVISGFLQDDSSDSREILAALGREYNTKNLDEISPFRLREAYSPLKAARMENKAIDFNEVAKFCFKAIDENDGILLIEGAGGVMTPINERTTFLDLAQKLQIPVILVASVYLGAISQILCALEALKTRNVEVAAIIINDFGQKNISPNAKDIADEVRIFNKIPCFFIDESIEKAEQIFDF